VRRVNAAPHPPGEFPENTAAHALRRRPTVLRIFALAALFGAGLTGGLYGAAARAERAPAATVAAPWEWSDGGSAIPVRAAPPAPALPEGIEVPEETAALVEAHSELVLDPVRGVRMGPASVVHRGARVRDDAAAASTRRSAREDGPRVRTPRVERAAAAPAPRLHPDPGRNVILTARAMIAGGEEVRGSCHRFLSDVFERAGHGGWRTRTVAYSGPREGPYADLDAVRPGDWLYIVNHPEATPVGTHSVLFVGWQDRSRGEAMVIEHPGWSAGPTTGRERSYDVSRTYRIVRPTLGAR
jgi:hypothetical protein